MMAREIPRAYVSSVDEWDFKNDIWGLLECGFHKGPKPMLLGFERTRLCSGRPRQDEFGCCYCARYRCAYLLERRVDVGSFKSIARPPGE